MLRLTYSDGNTVFVPAEMTGPSTLRLSAITIPLSGTNIQSFKIGNLRVNASGIGHGGHIFATVYLLGQAEDKINPTVVDCGSIASPIDFGVYASANSDTYLEQPKQVRWTSLPSSATIGDLVLADQLTFFVSFAELFKGVFRPREGESDSPFQWVTQGTRLQATFLAVPKTALFVTVYSFAARDPGQTREAAGARLVGTGFSESRGLWNNPFPNADGRIAIQRLPINESNGTANAVWEWFGTSQSEESFRRVTFSGIHEAEKRQLLWNALVALLSLRLVAPLGSPIFASSRRQWSG